MRVLREWIRRLGGTLLPGRRDADLEEELRYADEHDVATAACT